MEKQGEAIMSTNNIPGWSKMNFQKKSKPTASVAGRPSPKTLRKNKSTRSTKSEAQVPVQSGHKDKDTNKDKDKDKENDKNTDKYTDKDKLKFDCGKPRCQWRTVRTTIVRSRWSKISKRSLISRVSRDMCSWSVYG